MAKSDDKFVEQSIAESEAGSKGELTGGPGNVDKIRDILFGYTV